MLWMADFGQQKRTSELRKSVSESDHEAGADELLEVLASTLERGADDEDGATDPDADLSAIAVGDEWSDPSGVINES